MSPNLIANIMLEKICLIFNVQNDVILQYLNMILCQTMVNDYLLIATLQHSLLSVSYLY